MSAFLCSPKHISTLARYAVDNDLTDLTLRQVVDTLHSTNIDSLNSRYASREHFERSELADTDSVSSVQIIKAARCYRYQSCEHDGWKHSLAHDLILRIIAHAACEMALPGYDGAMWEIV